MKASKKLPKLIIDTDAGHDDVMAILMILKSEKFEVIAITTVAGNSTIENATRNTAFALDLVERRDIPIYSGGPRPLNRSLVQAVVHGTSGLDGADTSKTSYKLTQDAPDRIIELIKDNPGDVTILTLGPLTNMARVFDADPGVANLVKELVIMGGVVNGIGNKNRVSEFNMFVDPEAADIVFRSDVQKTLIPFDSCDDLILKITDFDRLKNTSLHQPVIKMMKPFIHGLRDDEGINGALLPDPLAAYFLLNPKAYTIKPMDIFIETKGQHTSGMTVIEKRRSKPKNCNANVAIKINTKVFVADFFKILRR